MLARKALAGTAGAPKVYVEDVFSTYLYTGNASTQTITNNIDISGKGGLVWTKSRSNATGHILFDTERGLGTSGNRPDLHTELTSAQVISGEGISSFNSDGYTLENTVSSNGSGRTFASWTFRKAKKFFDVVTYTGNGSNRTIAHNLGSVPGSIFIKRTDTTGAWAVYHRSLANTEYLVLNTTAAKATGTTYWNSTTPTSTEFSLGTATDVNANTGTYVAYLFAHDAGGFGDAGSDSIIKCGSWTTPSDGSDGEVNLGFEPQWLLFKRTDSTENWYMFDNMRGITTGGNDPYLFANLSNAETGSVNFISLTPTGFKGNLTWGGTYIYIAIRRGPMKTPTSGTSVFDVQTYSGNATANRFITTGFPIDANLTSSRNTSANPCLGARLYDGMHETYSTGTSYDTLTDWIDYDYNNGYELPTAYQYSNSSSYNYVSASFRRAPGFFDVVCYTGTGSQRTVSHNLGVAPELIIVKSRNDANDWAVYSSAIGNTKNLRLNTTAAESSALDLWASTTPSATTFTVTGTFNIVNGSTVTYVAYLFASLSGVSKVGSYTGNGSSVTVTTDFQPRFILVKRTDSTGNWIVGDSARGLVAGSDPYLLLNSTAAEDTDEDWVDITSTSFTVNQTTAANANVNTGTYIYLAIA